MDKARPRPGFRAAVQGALMKRDAPFVPAGVPVWHRVLATLAQHCLGVEAASALSGQLARECLAPCGVNALAAPCRRKPSLHLELKAAEIGVAMAH